MFMEDYERQENLPFKEEGDNDGPTTKRQRAQEELQQSGRDVHDQIQMVEFQGQLVHTIPTQNIMTTKLLLDLITLLLPQDNMEAHDDLRMIHNTMDYAMVFVDATLTLDNAKSSDDLTQKERSGDIDSHPRREETQDISLRSY